MLRVGLTGGIACGKTVVRRRLEELGIPTLDADSVVHRLLQPGTDVSLEVRRSFGKGVMAPDGSVDRKALGAIVFTDERARSKLNAIIHPQVWREIEEFFDTASRDGEPLAVVDAALMVETGSYRRYDCVVVVHCRSEQQLERLMERDGIDREDAEKRVRAQMPLEEKQRFADLLVDATGSIEETLSRTDEIVGELRRLSAK